MLLRLRLKYFVVFGLVMVFYIMVNLYLNKDVYKQIKSVLPFRNYDSIEYRNEIDEIAIAVVACESRLEEALVMIKSAIVFQSVTPLRFVIIADYHLQQEFDNTLKAWKLFVNDSFSYELHNLSFPKEKAREWRKLFQPCAAQRLFLPDLLSHINSVLYVDTDTIFLSPPADIWLHFKHMNSSQMAALSPEHEDPNTGWYNRFARHPYYGKLGVNSGVMLMNLTRMRSFKWKTYLDPIFKEYKLKLTWGDQDIINIIFHYHPDKLYIYPCHYDYRPDHCMYMSVCKSAELDGVVLLHGSRGVFHSLKQPAFKAVYDAFNQYQLGSDPYKNLLIPMSSSLEDVKSTACGSIGHIFTKNLEQHFSTVRNGISK